MTRFFLLAAIPVLMLGCSKNDPAVAPATNSATSPSAATVQAGIAWVKPEGASLEAAFARAKAENKPLFLYWGAVWCPPCNQIKATVFNRPDFIERSKGFIPVYLDGDTPGAQKLGAQFKVRGYPTTILFSPQGTELTRLPGEVDADAVHAGSQAGHDRCAAHQGNTGICAGAGQSGIACHVVGRMEDACLLRMGYRRSATAG